MSASIFAKATARRNAHALGEPDPAGLPKADARNRLYKAIRAACKRLGIEDDDRRALIGERYAKISMTKLTFGELGDLLDHLNRDWKGPLAHRAHVSKVRALWWSLYWLGEVADPNELAISAFVARQAKVSSLRFLDHTKAPAVIEALKSWLARVGVRWPTEAETAALAASNPDFTPGRHERHAVLEAITAGLGLTPADCQQSLARELGLGVRATAWNERELDNAIRHLGRRLRRQRTQDTAE